MSHIAFAKFDRLLARCEEIATAENAKPLVVLVYEKLFGAVARTFRDAHENFPAAQSAARKARAAAAESLAKFDRPFREARAVALSFVPTLVLPETLASQPTETDKVLVIRELLRILQQNEGSDWADAFADGPFAAQAAMVIEQIRLAREADLDLEAARIARAKAYQDARPHFYAFKKVVREGHGAKSWEYRRIHLRRGEEKQGAEAEAEAAAEAEPAAEAEAEAATAAEPAAEAEAVAVAAAEPAAEAVAVAVAAAEPPAPVRRDAKARESCEGQTAPTLISPSHPGTRCDPFSATCLWGQQGRGANLPVNGPVLGALEGPVTLLDRPKK
jgi:SWI/SNF-related matrix-associated actin-dependent regulator 1 of chromatin subfamily A